MSARPIHSDNQVPLYVLSIQERAEQLASHLEGRAMAQEVKFRRKRFALINYTLIQVGFFFNP